MNKQYKCLTPEENEEYQKFSAIEEAIRSCSYYFFCDIRCNAYKCIRDEITEDAYIKLRDELEQEKEALWNFWRNSVECNRWLTLAQKVENEVLGKNKPVDKTPTP